MWKNYQTLNRISESISGWHVGNSHNVIPYYVRCTQKENGEKSIEYTTDEQTEPEYHDDIFMTSAGEIDLYDEGEFGGHLDIGGRTVCQGNFSRIFEFKGSKYVIDDLRHMFSFRFRLIKVNDNGTVEVLYDASQDSALHDGHHLIFENEKYIPDLEYSVGLEAFYIGMDFCGEEKAFFLCSGHRFYSGKEGGRHMADIQYLLIFDAGNKEDPFVRIDIPEENASFDYVFSIWTDGIELAIGCDKEVVMLYLPDMSVEYWTGLGNEEVGKILKEKHRL